MASERTGIQRVIGPERRGTLAMGVAAMLVTAAVAGCGHPEKPKGDAPAASVGGIEAPAPPAFISGPMAPLLTNVEGFRAHVVFEGPPSATRRDIISGELMERGGELFFAAEPGVPTNKHTRAEDFSYLWTVAEGRGFLLNGPLQGYAPISSGVRVTNMVTTGSFGSERVAGYACQASQVKVSTSDGTETTLQAWRAGDLKGMPLRITGALGGKTFTLTLSRVHLEMPPADLFQPPGDFTRYASADGMMTELQTRQLDLKRKRGWQPPPSDEIGFRDANAPGLTH